MVCKEIQNAMVLVQVKGKPTFFITVTMDVKYKEVMELLETGESPCDRANVIV